MTDALDVLSPVAWLRWRLRAPERAVQLLDGSSRLVANARTCAADRRRNPLLAGLRLVLANDRLGEQPDWTLDSGSGDWLLRVTRTSPPRGVHGLLDAEHLVASDRPVGTIGRADGPGARPVTTRDGQVLRYAVTGARHLFAAAADLTDADGRSVVQIIPARLPEASAASTDGLVGPLDLALVPSPEATPDLRILALVAALLDTQSRDEEVSPRRAPARGRWRAPSGVPKAVAEEREVDRAHDGAHDRHVDDLEARARARGNDELADRMETRRRRRQD